MTRRGDGRRSENGKEEEKEKEKGGARRERLYRANLSLVAVKAILRRKKPETKIFKKETHTCTHTHTHTHQQENVKTVKKKERGEENNIWRERG